MALTGKGKVAVLVLVVGVAGAAFYVAQSRGLIGKKHADAQVDISAPAQPQEPAQQAQDAPQPQAQQPEPAVNNAAPVPTPQPAPSVSTANDSNDPSANRGMQFLLKQGKQ